MAQDDRVLGGAPLGQLVAAGVGVGIFVIDPSAVPGDNQIMIEKSPNNRKS